MSLYVEGDVPYCGNNSNNNGWNDWSWIIGLALVGGLFGGWGNGGFGFSGNRGGYGCGCGTPATQADLANGFAQNTLQRGIDDIILGQANMQNFINQGFAGINSTVTTGFANLNTALCGFNYNVQGSFNDLSHQLSDCCCATQRAIDSLKFENCQNTSAIINAGNANTRAILDYLTSEKISALQAENSGLKAQISNDKQSAYLISQLKEPCPVAAYVVQPPQSVTFPTNCCGNVAYAGYGSCGASIQ